MTNANPAVTEPAADEPTIWDKAKPATLRVVIGAVVAAGLIGAAAMIVGEFGPFHLRALLTVIMIVAFSLLVLYDAEVSSKRSHTFAFVGVLVSIYLLIAGILIVWIPAFNPVDRYPDEFSYSALSQAVLNIYGDFFQWIWLIIIARFALLHAHLLINIHRKYSTPLLQLTAKVTMGLIALFGLLLSIPHIFDFLTFSDTYWRSVGAVFILDVLGTVLIPLSYALFSPKPEEIPAGTYPPQYPLKEEQTPVSRPAPTGSYVSSDKTPAAPANRDDAVKDTSTKPVPTQAPANVGSTAAASVAAPIVSQPAPSQSAPVAPAPAPPAPAPAASFKQVSSPPQGSVRFEKPPVKSRKLAWPRYEDGTPLPILPDGTPDFSAVERY